MGIVKIDKVMKLAAEDELLDFFIFANEMTIRFLYPIMKERTGTHIQSDMAIMDLNGLSLSMFNKKTRDYIEKMS